MASAPSSVPTEPSKSRISARDMTLVPAAVPFEQPLERPQKRARNPVADVNGVQREREARAELPLDLRVGPAGDVVARSRRQSVFEIVKPTDRVEIVLAG